MIKIMMRFRISGHSCTVSKDFEQYIVQAGASLCCPAAKGRIDFARN